MSKSDRSRTLTRLLSSYVVAAISVGIAVVITLKLGSVIKDTATLFFCSVMLSSWYWSFHNLGDISLFKMKVMFYILWYAPGWEDITAQYIGRDALSCYRSAPSRKRCRGDREAARCTLGQCITLAYEMAPGWREGS